MSHGLLEHPSNRMSIRKDDNAIRVEGSSGPSPYDELDGPLHDNSTAGVPHWKKLILKDLRLSIHRDT
jgi:hypothetical protein